MIRRELCADRPVAIFLFHIRRSAKKGSSLGTP
jgi:hypothetical protein